MIWECMRETQTLGNGGMISKRRHSVEVIVTRKKIWKVKAGFCSGNLIHRRGRKMGLGFWVEKNIGVFHFCLEDRNINRLDYIP